MPKRRVKEHPNPITVTIAEVIEKGSVPVARAIEIIGCGESFFYDLVRSRYMPKIEKGGGMSIPLAAIEKHLKRKLVQGTAQ